MSDSEKALFADFAPTAPEHFRLCFFGGVLGLLEGIANASGSFENTLARFPFLFSYNNQFADRLSGLSFADAIERWCADLNSWENAATVHLPLRALRQLAGLTHRELLWLLAVGIIEEDARFGVIFESLHGAPGQRRPTLGFIRHCLPRPSSPNSAEDILLRLRQFGVLQVSNPEAPRPEWIFRFSNVVWDVLRSGKCQVDPSRMRYRAPEELISLEDLILPENIQAQVRAIPSWLSNTGSDGAVIVRGPSHNARHTILGAVARATGRGVLELADANLAEESARSESGLLAALLNALPVVEFAGTPGEPVKIPDLPVSSQNIGVVAGTGCGLTGARAANAVILDLELPAPAERERLWRRFAAGSDKPELQTIAGQFRLTSGYIQRAAQMTQSELTLAGREKIEPADVVKAMRALDRHGLDLLAQRLPVGSGLERLCASERTLSELNHLVRRCRHRELLPAALAGNPAGRPGCGVRALLTGPTGTGKTLAARLLAGTLQKDLYRLDLSSVVNKYIGETEKNLQRLFQCAEELDVVLLLDEGDALLTRRTDVHTANDRYANLETNFLLQRIESFSGILLITTNARERLDPAFERRMDVVVEFGPPAAEQRWELWRSHLPANAVVDDERLAQVSAICELTGGQIHNAVVYATLLALDNGGAVTTEYLNAAVRREYRKRGGVCPLRS